MSFMVWIALHFYINCCMCGVTAPATVQLNVTMSAKLASGYDAIYAYIANKPLKSSGSSTDIDTAAHKQIATIGHTFTETNLPDLDNLESWTIENESILGARLLREKKDGERIGNNQLMALRTKDAHAFMLGIVSWRSVTQDGRLRIGMQYLPGVAQACTLKAKGTGSSPEKPVSALLLPAMPALKIPGSLIIPRDAFQANRVCELTQPNNEKLNIKMGFSVSAGVDFERVSFISE
jgi:cyclic-di-GMP-binding protein